MRVKLVKQGVDYHFYSNRSPHYLRFIIEHEGNIIRISNYGMPIKLRSKRDRVLERASVWHCKYDPDGEQPFCVTIERMSRIGMLCIFNEWDNQSTIFLNFDSHYTEEV